MNIGYENQGLHLPDQLVAMTWWFCTARRWRMMAAFELNEKIAMPQRLLLFFALTVLLITMPTGCAEWRRNAYEGLRQREEILKPPGQPERTAPPPDYDTYRKEKPSSP
jgi:hypothetical protein